ncbi:MAG: hypothetical protein ACFFBP_13370 [Promethearchaeota archaeon]
MEHIERNFRILEKHLIDLMDKTLEYGNTLIDEELNLGVFNVIAKPFIKSFYNYWKNNDARQGTLLQIKTTLDCGKFICLNGNSSKEKFDEVVDQNFFKYLQGDQVYRQCKKDHKNFKKLKEIVKWAFISGLEEAIICLKVQDPIEDYESLVRAAFKTKEEAIKVLVKQLDFTDESLQIIEDDLNILKLPTGKNILIKTLRKGVNQNRINMINDLDKIYK